MEVRNKSYNTGFCGIVVSHKIKGGNDPVVAAIAEAQANGFKTLYDEFVKEGESLTEIVSLKSLSDNSDKEEQALELALGTLGEHNVKRITNANPKMKKDIMKHVAGLKAIAMNKTIN